MMRHIQLRLVVICAMLLAAAVMVAPSRATAQIDPTCPCPYITVNVDPALWCKVQVCMLVVNGNRNCITLAPGMSGQLRCLPGGTVYIRDCFGNLVPLDPTQPCTRGIGVAGNCCTVDVCVGVDNNGCQTLEITPSILDVCPCL